jgi:hypothetical protein
MGAHPYVPSVVYNIITLVILWRKDCHFIVLLIKTPIINNNRVLESMPPIGTIRVALF